MRRAAILAVLLAAPAAGATEPYRLAQAGWEEMGGRREGAGGANAAQPRPASPVPAPGPGVVPAPAGGWEPMGGRMQAQGATAATPAPAAAQQARPVPAPTPGATPGSGWTGMAGPSGGMGGASAPAGPSPSAGWTATGRAGTGGQSPGTAGLSQGGGWTGTGGSTAGMAGAGWESMEGRWAGAAGAASGPATGGWEGMSGRTEGIAAAAMSRLGARVEGNTIVVDLPGDVLFDFDRASIRRDAAASLEGLRAIILAQPSGGPVRIEGHTDSMGSDAYNQGLSERRAASVRAWLATRGIAVGRMATAGFGESRPVAPNARPDGRDDPEGRQRNRRVQVTITQG